MLDPYRPDGSGSPSLSRRDRPGGRENQQFEADHPVDRSRAAPPGMVKTVRVFRVVVSSVEPEVEVATEGDDARSNAADLVARTTQAQALPPTVETPAVLEPVARLVRAARGRRL